MKPVDGRSGYIAAICAVVLSHASGAEALRDVTAPQGISAADWGSICAAYESGRYAVGADGDEHRAWNPGHRWTTRFDGRGFDVVPNEHDWRWGLELVSWGRSGHEHAVDGAASVHVEGQRVTYAWDAALSEWYVNDWRGLEHGYTLRERLEGDGELSLVLNLRGDLCAEAATDGRAVRLLDDSGALILTYSGLTAFDADGLSVPARLESEERSLRLFIDDRKARYPVTIDPILQGAYVKASNTGSVDIFGRSVAIAGDTVVVGAPLEDSAATGVNGDQSNNAATESGAAYVFVRNGATWTQQAYLKASNTGPGDRFGWPVVLSTDGSTLVVGAWQEDGAASGVNGDQSNNAAPESGAAYVFVRSGGAWSQQAYLKASNPGSGDLFGRAIGISGDTVVIGATYEDSAATGVDSDQSSNAAADAGAAYVFVRNGETWSRQAYLKASNTDAYDGFGWQVAISDETVAITAFGERSSATGVNGDQADNTAWDAGAAYIFVRSGETWSQQAYLKASNTEPGDQFGCGEVAVSGDTVVVATFAEDSAATGIDGDQWDNGATDSGAVYVFVRTGGNWSQQAYLKASNTGTMDWFGWSLVLRDDTLVVGAVYEDSAATGINGDQWNGDAPIAGAAYLFERSGGSWSQSAYLKASNTGAGDHFGASVAMSGRTVVLCAPYEDSAASGVDGNEASNGAQDSGAMYVFELPPLNAPPICSVDGTQLDAMFSTLADGSYVVTEGETISAVVTGLDPDGDTLAVSFSGPPGATVEVDGAVATVSWTPTAADKALVPETLTITFAGLSGESTACGFTVGDVNLRPSCQAIALGEDGAMPTECASFLGAVVTLTGSATDGDDPPESLHYHWDVSDQSVALNDPEGGVATGLFPVGVTMATLTVADGRGGVSTCDVLVSVQDTTPPEVECTTSVAALWPPDHKMRDVQVVVRATDACIDPGAVLPLVVTVRSDEPDDAPGGGDGSTTGDVDGSDGYASPRNVTSKLTYQPSLGAWVGTVKLRAERAGSGDGRAYTFDVAAVDSAGNLAVTSCVVVVPHDRRPGAN